MKRVLKSLLVIICVFFSIIYLLKESVPAVEEGDGDILRRSNVHAAAASTCQLEIADYLVQIASLREKIVTLENELSRATTVTTTGKTRGALGDWKVDQGSGLRSLDWNAYLSQLRVQGGLFNGSGTVNDAELLTYVAFTTERLYLVDASPNRRVIERPIGLRRREISEVISEARLVLSSHTTEASLAYGLMRASPLAGTEYELFFNGDDEVHRVLLWRPLGPLLIQEVTQPPTSGLLNVIVPLSGRVDQFRLFVRGWIGALTHRDDRQSLHLTVVYFGHDSGLDEVRRLLGNLATQFGEDRARLLTVNEPFSRARGLQIGAQGWTRTPDVLMFFCDVDVIFTSDFIDRCRWHSSPGQSVFYPILFSLYNPSVVYSLRGMPVPPKSEQLVVSKETGFWRDFGYGMTCQYLSDFLAAGSFSDWEQGAGWGDEDVHLFRKHVRSGKMRVVRAIAPGIFHLWHEKNCDEKKLTAEQYRHCLASKALNEASHAELGLLAFRYKGTTAKSNLSGTVPPAAATAANPAFLLR